MTPFTKRPRTVVVVTRRARPPAARSASVAVASVPVMTVRSRHTASGNHRSRRASGTFAFGRDAAFLRTGMFLPRARMLRCDWSEHVRAFSETWRKKTSVVTGDPCAPLSGALARPRTPASARRGRVQPQAALLVPRHVRNVDVDRVRVRRRAHAPSVHPRESRGHAQPGRRRPRAVPRPGARHRRDRTGPVRHLCVARGVRRARGRTRRASMRSPRARRSVVSPRWPRRGGASAAPREATKGARRRRDDPRRDRRFDSRERAARDSVRDAQGLRRVLSR